LLNFLVPFVFILPLKIRDFITKFKNKRKQNTIEAKNQNKHTELAQDNETFQEQQNFKCVQE
jgi:hypothetical protein